MPGLGAGLGHGGATTNQADLSNADCILIEGSSMAEAHPVGFRWVLQAKERGAKVIHVDPRFSRTSALADLWIPIRAGSDIAFLGGVIRIILESGRYFRDYVENYTNAPLLVKAEFQDTEELDGLFSGWDPQKNAYDPSSWDYDRDEKGQPRRDPSLLHPRCVFQILRRHYSRYTPEMVESVSGIPRRHLERVAEMLLAASGPEKTAAICYSVGWTQHSKGPQIIRSATILQMLLGNIGRPGGGILALRGHASIQGSTDIPTLYDLLPGYIHMPKAKESPTFEEWVSQEKEKAGLKAAMKAYMISLMKSYYGGRAAPEHEWGFRWFPRINRDHSHLAYVTEMADGKVEGFFVMGQNPAVGSQNGRLERRALSRLRWLVVRDLVETETASFWYDSPEVKRGELRTEDIETEVFLFPAAGHAEKSGSFTNTHRHIQWREKAVEPPEDCRSETWFVHQLAKRLQAKAAASDDPRDAAIRALDWWYPEEPSGEPVPASILAEINGWKVDPAKGPEGVVHGSDREGRAHHGPQVQKPDELQDDGSTACGCWSYCGLYGPDGRNRPKERDPHGLYGHGWGYTWPHDVRILYNRASARPDGTPWSEAKKLVWWDADERKWTGEDRSYIPATRPPDYVPEKPEGVDGVPGTAPFIMFPEGLGRLFAPKRMWDGPLPTHYEPLESPLRNPLYSQQTNPPVDWHRRPDNRYSLPGDPRFPHILTTYRLTEHHTAGGMSRFLSHLSELQPEAFAEISPELAREVEVPNGEWITILSLRGAVEMRALVTRRIRPIHLNGRTLHQVAIPFHWGRAGLVKGGSANDLFPLSCEPNVSIGETKVSACRVMAGRLPPDSEFKAWFDRLVGKEG